MAPTALARNRVGKQKVLRLSKGNLGQSHFLPLLRTFPKASEPPSHVPCGSMGDAISSLEGSKDVSSSSHDISILLSCSPGTQLSWCSTQSFAYVVPST